MTVMRWLLFLPAAFAAYCALQFLFIALSVLLAVPEALNRGITQVIATIACPYYFVYIGSKIAPTARLYVSVALTVVLSLLYGTVLSLGVVRGTGSDPLWWVMVSLITGLASCVFAVVRIQNETIKLPQDGSSRWFAAVAHVLANVFGIVYVYGYFGQVILFLSMFRASILHNWLNLFNPLLYLMTMFNMLFTWYFWALLATAAIGYFGMQFFSRQVARLRPLTT